MPVYECAFDNVSVIHQLSIPTSDLPIVVRLLGLTQERAYFRNYRKLTDLRKKILLSGRKPYYFQPSDIESSALSASYDEIFSYVMPQLIKERLVTKENDLRVILKKHYVLLNNKWSLNNQQKTLL